MQTSFNRKVDILKRLREHAKFSQGDCSQVLPLSPAIGVYILFTLLWHLAVGGALFPVRIQSHNNTSPLWVELFSPIISIWASFKGDFIFF